MIPQALQYYATAPYDCSYLNGRVARSQVAAPVGAIRGTAYTALIKEGFRRSGSFIYRPQCDNCQACQSVRLPVQQFSPNRSQRRAWKQHQDLLVRITKPFFSAEHYALYNRYQSAKHTGGGMDHDDASQYVEFLVKSHVNTLMIEFRKPGAAGTAGSLQMVSIVDQLDDGLSAVYTFYEPAPGNNLGTYNVLWQIQHAKSLDLSHLYLGYWIEQSPKMAYKARFRPVEVLQNGHWTGLTAAT